MGETGENVAERWGVTREDQDAFALRSQRRWAEADFGDEARPGRRDRPRRAPRPDTSAEKLAATKPTFRAGGTVTAGNSSGLNDGAAALVASEEKARELSSSSAGTLEPLGAFVCSAVAGVDPRVMGIGPVPAVRKLLDRAGIGVSDLDLVELNEAFASQSLAVVRELGLDDEKVNVNGGAIAIGHPLGMSGAAWSSPSCTSCAAAAGATASRRCASASASGRVVRAVSRTKILVAVARAARAPARARRGAELEIQGRCAHDLMAAYAPRGTLDDTESQNERRSRRPLPATYTRVFQLDSDAARALEHARGSDGGRVKPFGEAAGARSSGRHGRPRPSTHLASSKTRPLPDGVERRRSRSASAISAGSAIVPAVAVATERVRALHRRRGRRRLVRSRPGRACDG